MAEDMNIAVDKFAKRSEYQTEAANDKESVSNYYRIKTHIPLLDGLCSHLTDRIGLAHQKVQSLMRLILVLMIGIFDTLPPAIELYFELHPADYEINCESGCTSGRVVKRLLR